MNSENFILVLVVVAVCIGIFFLIRSIILWYWKIDVIVENQNQQTEILRKQLLFIEAFAKKQGLVYTPAESTDTPEEIERKAKLYEQNKLQQ